MKRVLIVQRRLTSYRVPLFERMRLALAVQGVELKLVVGTALPYEIRKKDSAVIEWATVVPCHYFLSGRICWQDFGREAADVDLVIVTQENKLVYNLFFMLTKRKKRLAFWGHGRNMQAVNQDSLKERFKKWTSNKVDWWFAYNELSARLLSGAEVDESKVTVLDNSIDTNALRRSLSEVTAETIDVFRRKHSLDGKRVGLFLGSLYSEKRVRFLLDSARIISSKVPGFVLVIAGDGPDRALIEADGDQDYLRYIGPVHGDIKAVVLSVAEVMLNPGLVGLGILDSFCAGLPLVTTDCGLHSPEIDYLIPGVNGIMAEDSMLSFCESVEKVLLDEDFRLRLKQGALLASDRYTIENMSDRFCAGIISCLERYDI